MEWFEFDLKALNKMIDINKSDKEVSSLEDYTLINSEETTKAVSYTHLTLPTILLV